jgi:hypothetical protein
LGDREGSRGEHGRKKKARGVGVQVENAGCLREREWLRGGSHRRDREGWRKKKR